MAGAQWTGSPASWWTISNPTAQRTAGASWGGSYAYNLDQEMPAPFASFTLKWVSGDATIVCGFSTLAYLAANGTDELGIQYGFKFKPYATNSWSTFHDGSVMTTVAEAIDDTTEFKVTYDGSTVKWYVNDDLKDSVTEVPVGTFYLWTNNNRADGDGKVTAQVETGSVSVTTPTMPPPPAWVKI